MNRAQYRTLLTGWQQRALGHGATAHWRHPSRSTALCSPGGSSEPCGTRSPGAAAPLSGDRAQQEGCRNTRNRPQNYPLSRAAAAVAGPRTTPRRTCPRALRLPGSRVPANDTSRHAPGSSAADRQARAPALQIPAHRGSCGPRLAGTPCPKRRRTPAAPCLCPRGCDFCYYNVV